MKKAQYADMFILEDTYWWFLGKRVYVKAVLPKLSHNQKILDIGCGTGGFTRFLSKWGNVTGLEQDKTACDFAVKKGIRVIKGSANKLPFKDNSFDMVTIIDVLYHKGIHEKKALQEAYRVLKPHGKILLMDCALPLLWSSHDKVMEGRKRFLKHDLEQLLTHTGFIVLKSTYIFMITLPLIYIQRLFFTRYVKEPKITSLPEWLNKLLFLLISFEAYVVHFFNLPIGSSVLLYGQK